MGSGYPAAYRNGAGTGFQGSSRTSALEAAVAETQRQQAAKALNDAIAENERAGRAHKDPVSGAFRGKYGGGRGALGNPKAPGGPSCRLAALCVRRKAPCRFTRRPSGVDVEGVPRLSVGGSSCLAGAHPLRMCVVRSSVRVRPLVFLDKRRLRRCGYLDGLQFRYVGDIPRGLAAAYRFACEALCVALSTQSS